MCLIPHHAQKLINITSCRLWKSTIFSDSGKFWRWARLRVDPGLYPYQADDLLDSSILYKVPEIEIFPSYYGQVESLLQVVSQGDTPQLKKITFNSTIVSLTQVSPDILAGAAVKLERLELRLNTDVKVDIQIEEDDIDSD